jgi:GNAT superfamily N-acetyltransferase
MAVRIRDALPEDAEALARLLGQLGYPVEAQAVGRRLRRLSKAGDEVVVAELKGLVAGLAQLQISPALEYDADAAKFAVLVVDETHRGEGVGRALVEAIETRARARGCVLLYLTTAEHREGAHAFYRSIGLEHTGRRYAKRLP